MITRSQRAMPLRLLSRPRGFIDWGSASVKDDEVKRDAKECGEAMADDISDPDVRDDDAQNTQEKAKLAQALRTDLLAHHFACELVDAVLEGVDKSGHFRFAFPIGLN